ncbi:MAG TPA: hypothetical protein DEQ80_08020 [Anaerolinea thermolimosa]|uniref:Uncharacterized protein n=1 Tax=Anaerolinea thermolimosa TaxID=229919 RepID=A0A3D1JGR9_9CHLR|nr:hypothetical protein [Anaerolinea thermolimosa]
MMFLSCFHSWRDTIGSGWFTAMSHILIPMGSSHKSGQVLFSTMITQIVDINVPALYNAP